MRTYTIYPWRTLTGLREEQTLSITYPMSHRDEGSLTSIDSNVSETLRNLLHIPGVTEITLIKNGVWITLGRAFDWDDIEPRIITTINAGLSGETGTIAPQEPVRARIVVEHVPNERMRYFHTTAQISEQQIRGFDSRFETDDDASRPIGTVGSRLVHDILALIKEGDLTIYPYGFYVIVTEAASWDTLMPQLLQLVKRCFEKPEEAVVEEIRS